MALIDMKSDLAKGVGSKQTPQSFQDGHSATTVTGNKTFEIPPRIQIENKVFTAFSRQSEELTFQFNQNFNPKTIVEEQVPTLDKYYERAFNNADRLGARFEQRLGFDEPFILKGVGDRWGPGGLGKVDLGLVRAGAVTQAARTVADVQRIGKFLLTPRGVSFVLKQNVLQKMNANGLGVDGVPQGGSLVKKIGDVLGGKQPLPGPQQQRFSTGPDIFRDSPSGRGLGQGITTADEMKGSDIRTWRPTSIIDSLAIGAHSVRHLQPAGSPSVQLVKNVGNFVVNAGDGVVKFMDGIDVAFPQVSLNPNFQAGNILKGVGAAIKGAANGISDIFPNIGGFDKIQAPTIKLRRTDLEKPILGKSFSLTSMFPFLIDIPTPQTPNLSGIQNILGGLADTTANLLKGIGGGVASALGGIKLPSISLPPLPNFPSLPDVNIPSFSNPFSAISNSVKGIDIGFPKFSGKGGLNLGAIARTVSSAFPSVRLNADISKGSLSFDMAAFDEGKAAFQAGLKNLLTQPDALNAVGDKSFGRGGLNLPAYYNNGERYGVFVSDFGANLAYKQDGLDSVSTPDSYFTTAKESKDQNTRGSLRNIYDGGNTYSITLAQKQHDVAGVAGSEFGLGINLGDDFETNGIPFAIASGFASGERYGLNMGETDGFLYAKKKFSEKPITPKFPDNAVNASKDRLGNRIQRYEMLNYGQLGEDNRYEDTVQKADIVRGLGSQGAPGRTIADDEMGVVRMSSDGKYSSGLQDKVNLHPYGGSTVTDVINDTNIDFIPFKFRDMINGKWIIFRAILESVSDTSSPDYAEESYIGRPDKVYVYRGSTRNFNVTFKVMPKSVQEIITLWEKLNYLRGLTYPSIKQNRMVAPFASVTIGDMVNKLPVLLQSLNYSIDTQSTWEIKPGLRLPKLIQISADMRVIEPKLPQTTGKFYGLNWLRDDYDFGTFINDPSDVASLSPNRVGYDRGQDLGTNKATSYTHNSKHDFPHLFEELGITGVDEDLYAKLKKGEEAIKAAKAEIDALKSLPDAPNVDIPLPTIPFKF
tara:strand:- start:3872 stop:6991 length:3120 start_codon:yes stop_codon:yes gene_type:complete